MFYSSPINNTEQALYSDKYQYSYTVCKNSVLQNTVYV